MKTRELLDAYRKVQERNRLPDMELTGLGTDTKTTDDPWSCVENFAPREGWLGFQSRNHAFTEGLLPARAEMDGRLLSVECVDAKGCSLHLRQDGRGNWIATTYTPTEGESHLRDTVHHVVAAPPQESAETTTELSKALGFLRYRRYWENDAEHGTAPVAACFVGFTKEK